jgi:effector-binding domain-containing protein
MNAIPSRLLKTLTVTGTISLILSGCAPHRHQRLQLAPWNRPASRPSSQPTSRAAIHVSAMTIQTWPQQDYFFESRRTTALDVRQAIDRATAELAQAANDGKVRFTGPCIFVFLGRSTDLQKPFMLQVGFPVSPGVKPFGNLQVKSLAAFRCASVDFSGPGALIDKAYDKLEPAVEAAKLPRTDEVREVYINWDGPDSPDDQIRVGIGVRGNDER